MRYRQNHEVLIVIQLSVFFIFLSLILVLAQIKLIWSSKHSFNCFQFQMQRCITGFIISHDDSDKVQQTLCVLLFAIAICPFANSSDEVTKQFKMGIFKMQQLISPQIICKDAEISIFHETCLSLETFQKLSVRLLILSLQSLLSDETICTFEFI